MEIFDNITKVVRDDLKEKIRPKSKVSIAAACFSMYAYKELKNQLEKVDEFRFIFTSPTFIKERAEKQKREFYIPRLSRESSLYGTEFEIKLRNEMTQKAIAKECAEWIRKKAIFKSNVTGENMGGFMTVDSPVEQTAYMPINVYYSADDYDQKMLAMLECNIKDDRTDLDLLFGCLLEWGASVIVTVFIRDHRWMHRAYIQ